MTSVSACLRLRKVKSRVLPIRARDTRQLIGEYGELRGKRRIEDQAFGVVGHLLPFGQFADEGVVGAVETPLRRAVDEESVPPYW